ncbi:histidyl-tRNA synthetase, partial [mine drainage metagenome]
MAFQPLRGFRDYPPPEAGARSEIRRRMRSAARQSGFRELETPSIEPLDLYREKSGDEISSQVWAFRDKGDREVALTPETTPSLARIFAERAVSEPLPVKWFTVARLWRYEEPQAGRTREFLQFNLDILGVEGLDAEVDLLATAGH